VALSQRVLGVVLPLVLAAGGLAACTDSGETSEGTGGGTPRAGSSAAPSPPGDRKVGPQPTIAAKPPHPVSLLALMTTRYDGGGLRLVQERARTDAYTQHSVSYRSGDLSISGVLNVPTGRGPFPALVLAHGYIDPAVYVTGQGLVREQDFLARQGYVTLHVDYRNHAGSEDDPTSDTRLRLGYTEDVINAVLALRRGPRFVDDERIGLLGRSMGGGVVYNVLVVRPGLVDAAVVFAPVSSDTVDNFDRWIRNDPGRSSLASRIIARYGSPEQEPAFWRAASPRTYFDRVEEPLLVHHGTSDDSCPISWSRDTVAALRSAGKDVRLHVYEGEEHAFVPQWPLSMERTDAFFTRHLG
jgi:dipeptidyl aminopeptidase/acylaminoacyl peptidase